MAVEHRVLLVEVGLVSWRALIQQGFSNSAQMPFWARELCCNIVECLATSLTSTHHMPVAPSRRGCLPDDTKCLLHPLHHIGVMEESLVFIGRTSKCQNVQVCSLEPSSTLKDTLIYSGDEVNCQLLGEVSCLRNCSLMKASSESCSPLPGTVPHSCLSGPSSHF